MCVCVCVLFHFRVYLVLPFPRRRDGVIPSCPHPPFYRVLPSLSHSLGLPSFGGVSFGSNGVLPSFTEFLLVDVSLYRIARESNWILPSFTEFLTSSWVPFL